MEPLGALLGVGLSSGLAMGDPMGLGVAAGAMICVVSHEVIPETHRNSHQTPLPWAWWPSASPSTATAEDPPHRRPGRYARRMLEEMRKG